MFYERPDRENPRSNRRIGEYAVYQSLLLGTPECETAELARLLITVAKIVFHQHEMRLCSTSDLNAIIQDKIHALVYT